MLSCWAAAYVANICMTDMFILANVITSFSGTYVYTKHFFLDLIGNFIKSNIAKSHKFRLLKFNSPTGLHMSGNVIVKSQTFTASGSEYMYFCRLMFAIDPLQVAYQEIL